MMHILTPSERPVTTPDRPGRDIMHAAPDVPNKASDATWLYQLDGRLPDGSQDILYIGVAWDLGRRLKQHKKTKSWWREVTSITASLYPNRRAALAAESYGIRCPSFPPRYNIQIPRDYLINWEDDTQDADPRYVDLRPEDV